MRSTNALLGIICLCAFIALSCHKDASTETNTIDKVSIVPLQVGNSWLYSGTSYDTLGSVIETYGERMDVSKDSIISNVHYYLFNGFLSIDTDSGLVSLFGRTTNFYYKYPVVAGEKFRSIFSDCYVINTDTVIHVSIGTFHCVRYETFNGSIRLGIDFVSPGLGLVKHIGYQSVIYGNADQRIFDSTALSSFVLK